MAEFKKEYKQAVDRLEPDSRLIESLKADMKAAASPKVGFFVRYGWLLGSAAACLVVVLAVGVFLTLGNAELSGGSNWIEESIAANDGADLEGADDAPTEDAPYNAGAAEVEKSADCEADEASGGAYLDTTTAVSINDDEAEGNVITTTSKAAAETFFPSVAEDAADVYQILLATEEQIESLDSLNYSDLNKLVVTEQEDGLILSDFALYDYIDYLNYDGYHLVMRYCQDDVSFPVFATFQWMSPSDPVTSLKLYFSYEDPYNYIDLMQMSEEDLENCLLTDFWMIIGYNAIPLVADEVRGLRSVSSEMMAEWVEKAKRGTLTYGDFERSGHVILLPSERYECCIMGNLYHDESTGRNYAVVSCYLVQSAEAAPAFVILRDIDSGETLDLLHKYDMLDRFLSQ